MSSRGNEKSAGRASGVALAAAGTGVVATLVQSVFHAGSRAKFLQTNLVRNIVFFETYWLTWAGISALSPAIAASYTGVAVAGAACGFAAAAASALAGLRWSWRSMTQALRSGAGVRAALSSSVLFVVYQCVIDALTVLASDCVSGTRSRSSAACAMIRSVGRTLSRGKMSRPRT